LSLQITSKKIAIKSRVLSMNPEVPIQKRKFLYTIGQKRLILKEQESTKCTNTFIAQKYNVNESSIRKWKKFIDTDVQVVEDSKKKTMHAGKESMGAHLEGDLCQWIDNSRGLELDLTPEQVAFEIMKLDPEFCAGDLKRIRKWVYHFLVRNGYSIRQKTHIAQKELDIPGCIDCVVAVNERNRMYHVANEFIINMDETPLYNDQRPGKTIANKGQRSVHGKKTRTGEYRSTVILAVSLSGNKLPPMIIFKGKPGKTVEAGFKKPSMGFPNNVVCVCQEKAWNDSSTMLKWVELVYKPYVMNYTTGFKHLIIDDYGSHKTDDVQHAIKSTGSLLTILPGGCTGQIQVLDLIQVLDVGINKPFKDKFRTRWVNWMATENRDNEKVVSRQMLAVWVSEIWESMDMNLIKNSWVHCGYNQT
jgi:hypothetical protein